MDDFKCLLWRIITHAEPLSFIVKVNTTLYRVKKKSETKSICFCGWLVDSVMILTQRSAEIKGNRREEKKKKERKGLVSHAGGCQGCLPEETHIFCRSQIRNEQKFSSVHSGRRPDIKWRPWLSKQAPLLLCLPLSSYGISLLLLLGLRELLCKSNTDEVF